MKTLATAVVLGVCALPTVLCSPAAVAAPTDVALTAAVRGKTVTTIIVNNTGADIQCGVFGIKSGAVNPLDEIAFGIGLGEVATGGYADLVTVAPGSNPFTFSDVPVGEYTVDWGCYTTGFDTPFEGWGTRLAISEGATVEGDHRHRGRCSGAVRIVERPIAARCDSLRSWSSRPTTNTLGRVRAKPSLTARP